MRILRKHKRVSTSILLLCGILFVLLSGGAAFLHNHEADFNEHQDCPAHRIEAITVLLTFVFYVFFVFLFTGNNKIYFTPLRLPVTDFIKTVFLYRAPPSSLGW